MNQVYLKPMLATQDKRVTLVLFLFCYFVCGILTFTLSLLTILKRICSYHTKF